MRRLFLHIGAHKTGTTALQQSLHHHRVLLGVCGADYVSAPSVAHLHPYLGYATEGSLLPGGFALTEARVLADRLATGRQDMVIASSENFSFFFQAEAIEALERALRPLFDEVRILCYLRRQDRHAVSHHQEGAKPHRQAEGALWGHTPAALPAPSPGQALYLDYDRRLGLWADVFGTDKVDLRIYDRARLKEGDIFADFLQVIGLEVRGLASVGERNVSLGALQSKVGHLMNGLDLRPKVMEQILARIDGGGRLLPSQDQARAFVEPYRAGNRRLNVRFGVSDLPDLFNDDFTDYPQAPQSDWTEDGATGVLQAVLGHLSEVSPALTALTADDLRLAAQALQERHGDAALRLITAAQTLRPSGPVIQKLKAEIERQMEAP